mmetsp:Transcript_18554/g.44173  ORF Transcript_18554/g.44173 Transcript_18554/m.44173 type:complete len:211 (+) Transcript_18554:112-744(+)
MRDSAFSARMSSMRRSFSDDCSSGLRLGFFSASERRFSRSSFSAWRAFSLSSSSLLASGVGFCWSRLISASCAATLALSCSSCCWSLAASVAASAPILACSALFSSFTFFSSFSRPCPFSFNPLASRASVSARSIISSSFSITCSCCWTVVTYLASLLFFSCSCCMRVLCAWCASWRPACARASSSVRCSCAWTDCMRCRSSEPLARSSL